MLVLVALIPLALVLLATADFIVHESRAAVPKGFAFKALANNDSAIDLKINLISSNYAGLEERLYDISTPSSSNYGKHLGKEEVESYVAPTPDTTNAVTEWLLTYGITPRTASPAGDWLSFTTTVQTANDLLNTNFSTFTHKSSGKESVRTLSYSFPAKLQNHIKLVYPTVAFPHYNISLPVAVKAVPKEQRRVDSSCSQYITPACLEELYTIPDTPASSTDSFGLGVSGFGTQYAQTADFTQFVTGFTNLSSSLTFNVQLLYGGSNPQNSSEAGVEANLDIQYSTATSMGVPATFIQVGSDSSDGNGFYDIIEYYLNQSEIPQVLTTSYGLNEDQMSVALADTMCNAYMQIGARGTSVLFASGDGGVEGSGSETCTDFITTWPSTCPYVTSVGSTSGIPETAASFSAGGFSNYFGVPSFQQSVVSSYLSTLGNTNSGLFNASGRGYPDVSTMGNDVLIINAGEEVLVGGTSCSSPIFAGIIASLNSQLTASGRSPLGWLNPMLYSSASAFNDITSGDNPGCGTNGFPAAAGWDPVTGLGSPNYAALAAAVGL